jgi:cytoskeleton-associated protein 5
LTPGTSVSGRPGVATAGKKKGEEIDQSPPYAVNNLKNLRFKDEAKFKILKWNFATPRPEFVDQLKEQMTAANFNK